MEHSPVAPTPKAFSKGGRLNFPNLDNLWVDEREDVEVGTPSTDSTNLYAVENTYHSPVSRRCLFHKTTDEHFIEWRVSRRRRFLFHLTSSLLCSVIEASTVIGA